MLEEIKTEIDKMEYSEMLTMWRHAPFDSDETRKFLHGETGHYFSSVMQEKRSKLKDGEHSDISKLVGWDPSIRKYRVDE